MARSTPACDTASRYIEKNNTRTTFTKVGEVIYQASAKNSRQGELLIQDTLALDINNKDIVVLGVFLGCPQRVLSLKLENFPLNVKSFCSLLSCRPRPR